MFEQPQVVRQEKPSWAPVIQIEFRPLEKGRDK